ncbi:MAG TPA: AgmX/PglI C-terminal domain-containing protein [Kofleriaceae bacterium]|jgi:hypothetical protein|nr:AgmX/PglI C-terminal domain-containing protein [Kofleriaceae bacterium]
MTMAARSRCAAALVLGAVVLIAACGGKQKADTTAGEGGASAGGGAGAGGASSGDMVPPEKMDEVNRSLDRKRTIVSRCLAIAVDAKELPRNSAGKITLEIVISPSGRADAVKVVRTTLESKMLSDCVIHHVQEIQFPQLPKPYETSYTYGFEAM